MLARNALRSAPLVAIFLISTTTFAQGDTCTTALLITAGVHLADGPTSGDGAAIMGCGGGQNGDWYLYTASFTGTIKITSCHPLNNVFNDTFLKVLTGNCDSLSCFAYSDDLGTTACPGNGVASEREFYVSVGQNYYIVWTDRWASAPFYWELSECAGTVVGETYRDLNSNGMREMDEEHMNTMLRIEPGGHLVYSSQNLYSFCSDLGSYTITVPNPPLYHMAMPASRNYTIASQGDQVIGMDFGFQAIPGIIDVGIDLWGWSPWIGNNTTLQIHYSNPGTEPTSASVVLTLDPLISFVSASLAPSSSSGQNVSWDLGMLAAGSAGTISVTIHTSQTAPPNAPVLNYVVITTNGSDINPANNTDDLHSTATTSFDPNDKQVDFVTMTPEEVLARKPLEYTVRFQNTGTAPAVNIVIKDSLDADWDLSTFEMIGATHPYTLTVSNEVAIWTFSNILLPDSSTDPMGSQGSLHYRMAPKNNLILGDQLTNRADIYFDFNEPVLTNTTVTTVAISTGLDDRTAQQTLLVHPSPSTGSLTVRWMNSPVHNARITVLDALGRAVHTEQGARTIDSNGQVLDLATLSNGTYFLLVQGDGMRAIKRFVIAK